VGRRRAELCRSRVLGGEAEQLSLAHDCAGRWRWPWIGCNEIERHVGSTAVVVVQPEIEQQTQVPLMTSTQFLWVGVAWAGSPFECFDVFGQFDMEPSGVQQVANAQPDLVPIQGLRQEVVSSKYESPVARGPLFVGSEHDYGHENHPRPQAAQQMENLEAIRLRHMKVQKDDIRPELRENLLHLPGVSQAADFGIRVGQELRQQVDAAGFVVDNENALTHDAST